MPRLTHTTPKYRNTGHLGRQSSPSQAETTTSAPIAPRPVWSSTIDLSLNGWPTIGTRY